MTPDHVIFGTGPVGRATMHALVNRGQTVRMINRGGRPLANPTLKIWMPPRVTKVALAGDMIMRRNATLTGVPEEGACLMSLPLLTRNEERVLKLEIVEERPVPTGQASQHANR